MIALNTVVKLTEEELKEANELGYKRHMNNRKCNVVSDFSGRMGNFAEDADTPDYKIMRDQEGVRGEFAFAKLFNCGDETWQLIRAIGTQSATDGMDDGDAIMYGSDGTPIKIDVKTTGHERGNLLVTLNKLKDVSKPFIFVLLTEGEPGVFTYRGCMTNVRVDKLYRQGICTVESRGTVWVGQHLLKPVEVAVEYLCTGKILKH